MNLRWTPWALRRHALGRTSAPLQWYSAQVSRFILHPMLSGASCMFFVLWDCSCAAKATLNYRDQAVPFSRTQHHWPLQTPSSFSVCMTRMVCAKFHAFSVCGEPLGYSISVNSAVTLNPASEYLAGCNDCTEYATGMGNYSIVC